MTKARPATAAGGLSHHRTPVSGIEAQLVERPVVNRMDVGSNPTDPAIVFVGVVQQASTPASQAANAGSIPVTDT
jgi:hypothetical protein